MKEIIMMNLKIVVNNFGGNSLIISLIKIDN